MKAFTLVECLFYVLITAVLMFAAITFIADHNHRQEIRAIEGR